MFSLLYRFSDRLRNRARMRGTPIDLARGRRGEDLAHRFLSRQGYTIVGRNFRPRSGAGEIDLVAWDGDYLVFVEVKSRASDEFGTPDRAVDPDKQAHLVRAAGEYVRRSSVDWDHVRFDIVSILLTEPPRIDLLRDAFGPRRKL